jgi:cytoskeletal protein CcmA (bactofilin family)
MAIFKKTGDTDRPETPEAPRIGRARPAASGNKTIIGPSLVIKGEFSADEDLIIEGRIEGKIAHHKKNLTIGEQGRVKADIHAASVIVLGKLEGDIHSDGTVTLAKGCNVDGNIFSNRIVMEEGARFTGTIDMEESPKTPEVSKEMALADEVRKEVRREKKVQPTAKSSVL